MSKQIICDKCGRVIRDNEVYNHLEEMSRGVLIPLPVRHYDICRDCFGDVEKAMERNDGPQPTGAR